MTLRGFVIVVKNNSLTLKSLLSNDFKGLIYFTATNQKQMVHKTILIVRKKLYEINNAMWL